ncbi:unnamed protein product [Rotaria sordida]|uniref:Uncharacterized protein n=1 Tax=Rotaria sordida TaxID=392033 RepID=A0A815HQG1_9BILA|nr:unnamed protein product [Rotaria sordida]CAF3904345.1 unnamed protein product [Rotaria sordida]
MSTESDTDPENSGVHISASLRDVLFDPVFACAAAAAAGSPTVGGISSVNAINGRLQQYIQSLDPDVQLSTLNELCSGSFKKQNINN